LFVGPYLACSSTILRHIWGCSYKIIGARENSKVIIHVITYMRSGPTTVVAYFHVTDERTDGRTTGKLRCHKCAMKNIMCIAR